MAESAGTRGNRRRTGQRIAVVLVLAVVSAWYLWVQGRRNLLPDESIYSFVGWSWANGDHLYRDVWDHKGPVVFVVTALRTGLLGNSPTLVGVQEVVLGAATALIIGLAAARMWGTAAGAITVVISTLAWAHPGPTGGQVSTAGSAIALLTSIAILLLTRINEPRAPGSVPRAAFAFGVVQGLLFLAKPNAIVTAPLILLASWPEPPRARHLARTVATAVLGAVSVVLLACLAFAARGTFPDFLDGTFLFNMQRAGAGFDEQGAVSILVSIVRLVQRYQMTALLAAVGGAWMLLTVRRQPGNRVAGDAFAMHVAALWIGLELVGLWSNAAYAHHIFTLLFALSLGAGWLFHVIATRMQAAQGTPVTLAVLLLIVSPWIAHMASVDRVVAQPAYEAAGEYLAATTAPDERVLTFPGWLGSATLFIAERHTANRYVTPIPLYLRGSASEARWAQYAAALDGPNPVHTVVADLLGRHQWANPDSMQVLVQHLDLPMSSLATDPGPFPSRERAKRILAEEFALDRCFVDICILRRSAVSR